MIAKIKTIIESGQRFLVASHRSPDGDALASTLALTLALRAAGKEAVAYNADGAVLPFDTLPGADTLVTQLAPTEVFDATFVLDAGELRRAGLPQGPDYGALVNIDHHPHSEDFGAVYWVDTAACATGMMIYRLLQGAGFPTDLPIATCLYASILADTGSFRYSNANTEAFRVAAELVALGVNTWEVSHALYESNRLPRLRLLGRVLDTLEVAPHGRWATVTATLAMMEAAGAVAEDTDGFINYPRGLRGVEVAVFFRQIDADNWKIGFRSQGTYDVGALSRTLGGGGHRNAAGGHLEGELASIRQRVALELDRMLLPPGQA